MDKKAQESEDDRSQADIAFRKQLAAARNGNTDALEGLVSMVDGVLTDLTRQEIGAGRGLQVNRSDVIQTAYLMILKGLASFNGTTRKEFVSWSMSVLQNTVRKGDRFQNAKKRKLPSSSREMRVIVSALEKPNRTPSSVVAHAEDLVLADLALANLSEDYRTVILLSAVEERPHREVAELMGRGEGAIRMLLVRARVALSREIERLEEK